MKNKNWTFAQYSQIDFNHIVANFGIESILAGVLCARGFINQQDIADFTNIGLSDFYDAYLLKDMKKAIDIIESAVDNHKKIVVFGDYDVDGVISTTILVDFLKNKGADCFYYIPDRMKEGYGLNKAAILDLKSRAADLIITVDLGITAIEEIEYARRLGVDVIVTDHHECLKVLPNADAILNPKQPGCGYPFKELCGTGVIFKLLCALSKNDLEVINKYSVFAAIGTISDVVLLCDENRAIVKTGLAKVKDSKNYGLKMLIREVNININQVTSNVVSFILAPRINAAGRLGKASDAVEMFLSDKIDVAAGMASKLCLQNRCRQDIENDILKQAIEIIDAEHNDRKDKIIVLWGENWHNGVIGIVASRISEKYACPVMLISVEDEVGRGSGRSVGGFNMFEALTYCSHYLDKFGGHKLAAGLSIKKENLEDFKKSLIEYADTRVSDEGLIATLNVDCVIDAKDVTIENIKTLEVLEPYGSGNPQPVFCIRNMEVIEIVPISVDRHIKLILMQDNIKLIGMIFGMSSDECGFAQGNFVDVCANIEINEFKGHKNPQLVIKDINLSEQERKTDDFYLDSYRKYMTGQAITKDEAESLYPMRSDLVAVWKYINRREKNDKFAVLCDAFARKVSWEAQRYINIGKIFVCLDAFSEVGLLSYDFVNQMLNINLKCYSGKADVTNSAVLSALENRKKGN